MTIGSWGRAEIPLLPHALRAYFVERRCPVAVLDVCEPKTARLDQLDGSQVRPIGSQWPREATDAVLAIVGDAFEVFPELLGTQVWTPDEHLDRSLDELPLTTRAHSCLQWASLLRIRDLRDLRWRDLTSIRNLGTRTLLDILCTLEALPGAGQSCVEASEGRTQKVFEVWSEITGTELTGELIRRFHREAFELFLATWPESLLTGAGRRVHAIRGQLRLVEWADELQYPGLVVLETAPLRWAESAQDEAETIRQALIGLLTRDAEDRDVEIITQTYGLSGADIRTRAEIAAFAGLSGERIRQLQEKILRRAAAQADNDPMSQALVRTLRILADDGRNIIGTALALLPKTPVRATVDLLARLLGSTREERVQLRESLGLQLDRAARRRESPEQKARREERQAAVAARVQTLRGDAYWPDAKSDNPLDIPMPLRLVDDEPPPYSLTSAKMAREIAVESSIELRFFRLCEASTDVLWFCEQPAIIDYYYDNRWRQYYPDALVAFTDGTHLLVEVKYLLECSFTINRAKWAAARAWCTDRGIGFLVTDSRQTQRSIEEHQPDPQHVQILADALKAGPMTWLEHLDLRREVGFSAMDLTAAALRNGWDHRLAPWRLSLGEEGSSV